MIIEENDFKMEKDGGSLWDLSLLKTIRPKGKPERQELVLDGYGMTFNRCMQRIIDNRIERKQEVLTIKEYITLFKEESDKLIKYKNM